MSKRKKIREGGKKNLKGKDRVLIPVNKKGESRLKRAPKKAFRSSPPNNTRIRKKKPPGNPWTKKRISQGGT